MIFSFSLLLADFVPLSFLAIIVSHLLTVNKKMARSALSLIYTRLYDEKWGKIKKSTKFR
jgi:hypothetical protein